jgi:hypothetical protein
MYSSGVFWCISRVILVPSGGSVVGVLPSINVSCGVSRRMLAKKKKRSFSPEHRSKSGNSVSHLANSYFRMCRFDGEKYVFCFKFPSGG